MPAILSIRSSDQLAEEYRRGSGQIANQIGPWSQINLVTPVQGVDRVAVPQSAAGGSDPQSPETVVRFAPDFASSIVARKTLSPLDLEREFGLSGGDIFHGALSLDQLFSARPVLGHGNYRGPIDGLYMCGAGTHPGGGVTGAPGHNAAREILRDARRWGQSRISRRSP